MPSTSSARRPPRVRLGIIGWAYPEWRGHLYPKGTKPEDFLATYAGHFDVVEVASSFYGMPDASAVAEWAKRTPKGFELSLKAPEGITRKPDDAAQGLATLVKRLEPLTTAKKLGVVVAQFPPTFKRDNRAASLEAFVKALPKAPGVRWAVELRHDSWWVDETYELLRKKKATLVWSDLGKLRAPPVATSDRLYLRLFGDKTLTPPWNKKRRDASKTLEYWAARIQDEGAKAKRVDVMLSKYLEGYAPASAETMATLLAS